MNGRGLIIDPHEAAMYEEVRRAHEANTPDGQRVLRLDRAKQAGSLGAGGVLDTRPLKNAPLPNQGASIVLSIDTTIDDAQVPFVQLFRIQNNDERYAENLTITCQAQAVGASFTPGQFMPTNAARIRGMLEWGMGQATFKAFFDIHRGTTITVPATFVALSAQYTSAVPVIVGSKWPDFQVSAGVGYGSVGFRTAPATFTDRVTLLGVGAAPANFIALQIPPWAKSFSVATTVVPPDLTMDVTVGAPVALARYRYTNETNLGHHYENLYALPNGSERLNITNNSAAATDVAIIYTLEF